MIAATIGAHTALVRFGGFHYLPGSQRATLRRWDTDGSCTMVRFDDAGNARIVRKWKGNRMRARHVIRCADWLYATDVERAVRAWTDDYLPSLQTAAAAA